MRKSMKITAVLGGGAIVLATAGVAYAYWTTGGTGVGTASTRPGVNNQLSVVGNVPNAMYPGDTAQTITATVTNNGSENYQVNTLTAYVTIDATHATAGCAASDYTLNASDAPGTLGTAADLGITPADLAPTTSTSVTYTIKFHNKSTAQNFCKGADVTVHYTAA